MVVCVSPSRRSGTYARELSVRTSQQTAPLHRSLPHYAACINQAEERIGNEIEEAVLGSQQLWRQLAQITLCQLVMGAFVTGVCDFDHRFVCQMALNGEIPLLVVGSFHLVGPCRAEPEADTGKQPR